MSIAFKKIRIYTLKICCFCDSLTLDCGKCISFPSPPPNDAPDFKTV